jgi:diguanylate cyclase (GGDEF)-like protein
MRESDVVARWGGEEFAILLPAVPEDGAAEALRTLDRARIAVAARPILLGPGLGSAVVTISAGVALYPAVRDPADLVRTADQALYRAKESGRNAVRAG